MAMLVGCWQAFVANNCPSCKATARIGFGNWHQWYAGSASNLTIPLTYLSIICQLEYMVSEAGVYELDIIDAQWFDDDYLSKEAN